MTARIAAIVRLKTKTSPYKHEERGTYLQIAVPNTAITAFGRVLPSFERPYKLEPDVLVVTQEDIKRVFARWEHYYDMTAITKD